MDYRHLKTIIDKLPVRAMEEFDPSLGAFKCICRDEFVLDELEALFIDRASLELAKVSEFYDHLEKQAMSRLQQIGKEIEKMNIEVMDQPNRVGIRIGSSKSQGKSKFKKAIREYHRSLELIANFQHLNYQAFVKILKKFDKRTLRKMSLVFMSTVKETRFYTSDEISNCRDNVENMYRRTFAGGSRSQALQELRTVDKQGRSFHVEAFVGGLLFGLCLVIIGKIFSIALSGADRVLFLAASGLFLGLPLALSTLFLVNVFIWEAAHVNYRFIFEFNPRSVLHPAELLVLIAGLNMIFLGSIFASVARYLDPYIAPVHQPWLPIGSVLAVLLLPLPVFYHSSRLWFAGRVFRIILTPFVKVSFADFYLADQLMSLLMSFQTAGWLIYMTRLNSGEFLALNELSRRAVHVAACLLVLPPLFRIAQCLRRYFDDGCRSFFPHLLNCCKYLFPLASSIVAIWAASRRWATILSIVIRALGSLFALTWDLTMDFGLLQTGHMNWLLRENLVFQQPSLYYFIMVFDIVGRLFWLLPLLGVFPRSMSSLSQLILLAVVEIMRRFFWNCLRIEYEHVNNCSTLRAFRDLPLPLTAKDLFYHDPAKEDQTQDDSNEQ